VLSAKGNASFFGFGPKGAAQMDFSGHERKKLFCNQGGKKLVDVSYFSGIDSAQDGRTVAVADLDHDGIPELIVAMRDRPLFHVWSRTGARTTRALVLRVSGDGRTSPAGALGAIVRAEACDGHSLTRVVAAGTGFGAQDSATLTIGAGTCEKLPSLTVRWPSGLEKTFKDVKTDELYEVNEQRLHNVPGYFQARRTGSAAAPTPVPAGGGSVFLATLAATPVWDARGTRSFPTGHDVVYVDFWASWCEACKRNQPAVDALSRRFADRVDFVGVSLEEHDGAKAVAEHAKSTAYPLAGSDSPAAVIAASRAIVGDHPALPHTALISRRTGTVLWQGAGVPTVSEVEATLSRARDGG